MLDREVIKKLALQYQATEINVVREYVQHLFLSIFYQEPDSEKVLFKGGTALRIVFQSLRFSEDLDFSVLKKEDFSKIMDRIGKERGFDVTEKRFGTSLFYKFKFGGFITKSNRVSLNIMFHQKPLYYSVKSYVSPYIDVSPFMLNVMELKEILAEKVHAIYHRNSARDMYDLFYLLRIESPDLSVIKSKVPEYENKEFLNKLKKYKGIWDNEIKVFAMEYIHYGMAYKYICEKMSQ